jgi:hypothetical protein
MRRRLSRTPGGWGAYALNAVIEYKLTVNKDGNVTLTNVVSPTRDDADPDDDSSLAPARPRSTPTATR